MNARYSAEWGSTGSDDTSRFHALSGGNTGQPASVGPRDTTPASACGTPPSSGGTTEASEDATEPASPGERAIGPPHAERASRAQPMRIYKFKYRPTSISTRSQGVHGIDGACSPGRDPARHERHCDEQRRSGDEARGVRRNETRHDRRQRPRSSHGEHRSNGEASQRESQPLTHHHAH